MLLTVVIPTVNEAAGIAGCIDSAQRAGADEIIVVDGGSTDDTIDLARRAGAMTSAATPGRAAQMNAGATLARGDVLLFLHADSRLPIGGGSAVTTALADHRCALTAFRPRLDADGAAYRCLEQAIWLRTRLLSRPYGDQGLALRRATFAAIGGFRTIPILEDVHLVRAARRLGRLTSLPQCVTTSARRWQARGFLRTSLINQVVLAGAMVGVAPDRLARFREGTTGARSGHRIDAAPTSTAWSK
ncbi:MAG: TIGR04283 family arsenosugar biosynthesis glycosyltransferase [Planctomycetota bacterium]|jgi:rSAM/selenodomain-associated transferase 2